jgi:hypothetical protein
MNSEVFVVKICFTYQKLEPLTYEINNSIINYVLPICVLLVYTFVHCKSFLNLS